MEPFKALIFIAATGIVSLVGVGAAGFYAGYSAGRGNLEEIKAQIAKAPVAIAGGSGGAVSLAPVREDIKALAKQVEALAAVKAHPAAAPEPGVNAAVLEELKVLSKQLEALKAAPARPAEVASAPDLSGALKELREQISGLSAKLDKQEPKTPKAVVEEIRALNASVQAQEPNTRRAVAEELRTAVAALQNTEPKAPKAVVDEIRALNASVQAQEPNTRRAVAEELRTAVTALQNAEPKAPKAVVEEIRSLNATVQAQEPNTRRAVAEELRTAVAALQNTEPKAPKAVMDELRSISANIRTQDSRPQASVVDQIKVLAASVEALKAKIAEDSARGRGDTGIGAEAGQLRQLIAAASEQFGKCQNQLASLSSAAPQAPQPAAPAAASIAVTAGTHHEPSTVVFYDNVMLKKDQEKQYDEIGVKLALQAVGPRQVKLAVNRQGFGLAFGERKVFRSQDVECELNLMETNLNDAQARVSISCKR